MSREDPQVNFRLPAELLQRLRFSAATSNRTVTAELVSRLESSFDAKPWLDKPTAERLIEALQDYVARP
ncbi:Arc family DNA-binding protein [Stenotrophomonas sp.]|uniref:Arc family DNA-binding protein n=1 Tax=Stenotrophomonas sp. TaxID=69392 RepID=UPI0028AA346F|nr:Arc family DNA-binding protein [Stenotrophomonas sp.]